MEKVHSKATKPVNELLNHQNDERVRRLSSYPLYTKRLRDYILLAHNLIKVKLNQSLFQLNKYKHIKRRPRTCVLQNMLSIEKL